MKTEQLISQGMIQGEDKDQLRDQYRSKRGRDFVKNIVRNELTLNRLKELNK